MSRQDANANFALTSFLDGANATYIDQLYAQYEKDPSSVDPDWVDFFKSLKDQPADVAKNAKVRPGKRPTGLPRRATI
jgi:2-oxoglutarate dehydrogenase E1 component